ncbi:ATP-binding cassette domain-containing protein, partial [Enterococcus faecalis]|nr:ATP-binding cassette domain-containing protein [Enterococcus faecalis]
MSEETILQVKNLHVDFQTYAGEIKAIRDVNFDLKKGETLAIVGESGSGKSVTTKTLMGLS